MLRVLPLTLIVSLTACVAAKDYPSLERRPAERVSGGGEAVTPEAPPPSPAPLSTELTTRLAQLVNRAKAAHQRFTAKRTNAARQVAAGGGGAPGSEGWSVATVALADLESVRSDAMVALADLDELYANESVAAAAGSDPGNVTAVNAARDQVTALVGEEDDVLADLRSRMRG